MAKKPIPPNLDSILNSPENKNMNAAVRAQIEAAQVQFEKETKEVKETTKQVKQAEKQAIKEIKQAEKQAIKEIKQAEKKTFKDKISDIDNSEFNENFPLLGKMIKGANNGNGASTDSGYFILTDIVSSQQTTINLLKQILRALKDDNDESGSGINIPGFGNLGRSRGRGRTGGAKASGVGAGGGRLGGLLRILGLAFAGVGVGALGAAAYDRIFNNSSDDDENINSESVIPPAITPEPPATPVPPVVNPAIQLISPNVNNYNPEPAPPETTISGIQQAQRARIELAGTTAAQLMGRGAPPAGRINSDAERAFRAIPQAINSPEGSRTQRTLGFTPEQYGPPVPTAQPAAPAAQPPIAVTSAAPAAQPAQPAAPAAQPAQAASVASVAPAAQPEDAARQRRLQAVRDIGTRADAFKAGVDRIATPLTNTFGNMQEKRGEIEEEDGVKQYKADEIVFKADKFDFGNSQTATTSSPAASGSPAAPAAPPAAASGSPAAPSAPAAASGSPAAPSAPAAASGSPSVPVAQSAASGSPAAPAAPPAAPATPIQTTATTGSRVSRASTQYEIASRRMPTPPPWVSPDRRTRQPAELRNTDASSQLDPNNPGSIEPADSNSRYARLFGMA